MRNIFFPHYLSGEPLPLPAFRIYSGNVEIRQMTGRQWKAEWRKNASVCLYNKAGCGMLKAIRNDAWLSVCLSELSR